jgi:hypothetical protein
VSHQHLAKSWVQLVCLFIFGLMLGRHSTSWATPPVLFCFGYSRDRLWHWPRPPWPSNLLFMLPVIAGVTAAGTNILPMSASDIA